jgi:hypothetical protein
MTYQPARPTETGIEGASFSVGYEAPGLPDNPYFSGPVPITYTLGKVTASVTLNPVTYDASAGTSAPATGATAALEPGVGEGAGPDVGSDVDAAFAGTSGLVPHTGDLAGSTPAASGGADSVRTATFLPAAATAPTDLTWVYAAFAGTALAALLSMTALSLVGVRPTWKS